MTPVDKEYAMNFFINHTYKMSQELYSVCFLIVLCFLRYKYSKTSNISRILVGNKIVDNSDVVGASPVGTAPTTSSFST